MKQREYLLLVVLYVLAAVIAGCGGGGKSGEREDEANDVEVLSAEEVNDEWTDPVHSGNDDLSSTEEEEVMSEEGWFAEEDVEGEGSDSDSGDDSEADLPDSDYSLPGETYFIAFAANFDTTGGCHRDDPWGCDLYVAEYDTATHEARNLRRIAGEPSIAEWFPAIDPSGRFVAYNRMRKDRQGTVFNDIWVADIFSGVTKPLVANGRFPHFAPDGKTLYFSREGIRTDIFSATLQYDVSTGDVSASSSPVQLTNASHAGGGVSDPAFLSGTSLLMVMYQQAPQGPAAVGSFDLSAGTIVPLTQFDSSAHPSTSPSGAAVAYGNASSGGVSVQRYAGEGSWYEPVALSLPSTAFFVSDDTRYGAVQSVHYDYPEWAGEHRFVVSVHGGDGTVYSLSRLALLEGMADDFSQLSVRYLGKDLETAAGKSGADLCTAAVRVGLPPKRAVIYAMVALHNGNPNILRGSEPAFPKCSEDMGVYQIYRDGLVNFAAALFERGVPLNVQSDWDFLKAADNFEDLLPPYNGKNMIQHLQQDFGVEFDALVHPTTPVDHTFADVACLITEIGGDVSAVAGGAIVAPPSESEFDTFLSPMVSTDPAGCEWQPEIIFGGATRNHVDEEALWISGIWRPSSKDEFTTHDPIGPLISVGPYKQGIQGLDDLLGKALIGTLDPAKIYTIAIYFDHEMLADPSYIQQTASFFEDYAHFVDAGLLKWATIEEVVSLWQTIYHEEPNLLLYE